MGETRRKFDRDFREGAVRLVGRPASLAQVARDLGINEGTLGNWVNADRCRRGGGDGQLGEDERAELVRLRIENAEQQMRCDVLKRSVAQGSGRDGRDQGSPAQAAARLRAWLQTSSRPSLVVLDDLVDPADMQGLWPPTNSLGRVLVTTQRRDAVLSGEGRRVVDVGLFTPAEAVAYVTAKLAAHGRTEQPEQVEALAADLGRHNVNAGRSQAQHRPTVPGTVGLPGT